MAKSVHQLHQEAMVVDTHCDTPLRIDEEHADLGVRSNEGHNDFIRMKEGGLDLMFYAIFTRVRLTPDQSTVQAVRLIGETKDMIAANRDKVALAYSVRHARQTEGLPGFRQTADSMPHQIGVVRVFIEHAVHSLQNPGMDVPYHVPEIRGDDSFHQRAVQLKQLPQLAYRFHEYLPEYHDHYLLQLYYYPDE